MKKQIVCAMLAIGVWNGVSAQQTFTFQFDGTGSTVGSSSREPDKQIELGTAAQEIFYDYRCLRDTTDHSKVREDVMVLQIGGNLSKFYSYRKMQGDSLLTNASPQEVMADPSKFIVPGAQSYMVFKNHPAGKLTYTDKVSRDNMRYEEEMPDFAWQLLDETKEIKGYTCHAAECDFRGRRYVAWYAPEIPISNGPWKFGGLPGLILEVADREGHYAFTLNGIRNNISREITMPDVPYHKTDRVKFLKNYRQFETDPVAYMSANSNVNIIVRKSDGSPHDEAMGAKELKFDYMELDYQ